jgi:sialidase-1
MRPNAPGFRQLALSYDGGRTFGPMWTSTLIDPGANADQLAYLRPSDVNPRTGAPLTTDTMLFSNNADGLNRVNLTVRLSHDDGTTWPHAGLLAPGAAGYSAMTVLADGSIGDLYEVGATGGIVFDRLSLDWLRT